MQIKLGFEADDANFRPPSVHLLCIYARVCGVCVCGVWARVQGCVCVCVCVCVEVNVWYVGPIFVLMTRFTHYSWNKKIESEKQVHLNIYEV